MLASSTSPQALSAPRPRTRVLVVDDHPSFRLGLETLLERERDFEIVGHAASAIEALDLDACLHPDLIVIDMMLHDSCGIALTRSLVARRHVRILGLSVFDEPVRIAEMLRAGALGFALKSQAIEEVVDAVRLTVSYTRYLPPELRDEVERIMRSADKLPLERLTRREREIFELLIRGLSNDAIGQRLFIAPRTADTHRHHVLKKLGAHSIADLVRLAARWGALT